jgi:hypothetical protein
LGGSYLLIEREKMGPISETKGYIEKHGNINSNKKEKI